MTKAIFKVPAAYNEPIYEYRKNSTERLELVRTLRDYKSKVVDVPMIIGGMEIKNH